MTLRQVPASSGEEKLSNVEQGLLKGKEAVGMDTTDGQSWSLLGNAYLSHFFQVLYICRCGIILTFVGITITGFSKSENLEASNVSLQPG